MKNYLLLFKGGLMQEKSPEQWQEHMLDWKNWMDELGKKGIVTGGHQLKQDGSVMSKEKNKIVDKPYAEAKEVVGGFITINAESQKEAIEIAKGCPVFKVDGTCEVAEVIQN